MHKDANDDHHHNIYYKKHAGLLSDFILAGAVDANVNWELKRLSQS